LSELERCSNYISEKQVYEAFECLKQAKGELNNMSGVGRKIVKPQIEELISIEEQKLEILDGVNYETLKIRYNAAKRKERYIDKNANGQNSKDKESSKVAFRATLISIISKIEGIAMAYEEKDLDTCKDLLELAQLLFYDIEQYDENTLVVKKEIDRWEQILSHEL